MLVGLDPPPKVQQLLLESSLLEELLLLDSELEEEELLLDPELEELLPLTSLRTDSSRPARAAVGHAIDRPKSSHPAHPMVHPRIGCHHVTARLGSVAGLPNESMRGATPW